ncbi:MAG: 3-deoxy-manno-octulosonate cytidylyltransferase [Halobacteriovoraceae bacterium]|nr:3-deoxy-manno-octulosonate cytidylyltransferase [Halobacteriovoraceae bacterium]MCB9093789.1 3-deoxy-manno-octulosonate cytidylyltransferase [Halobacteriovoraceae bacterium]
MVILIPSRYGSTRFPGKPLSKISGKSLIQRVYDNVSSSGFATYVVTDHSKIAEHVENFQGQVLRVDDDVASGSERIALAYQRHLSSEAEYIVNVQGDEPLLTGHRVKELVEFHQNSDFDICTMYRKRDDGGKNNPNIVKIALNELTGRCLYFSRAAIPYVRGDDRPEGPWYQHIGVYCFKKESLLKFFKLKATALEETECLEQLRALENGMTIGALEVTEQLMGVDTPEDVEALEKIL